MTEIMIHAGAYLLVGVVIGLCLGACLIVVRDERRAKQETEWMRRHVNGGKK
jgi:hypothetical protein